MKLVGVVSRHQKFRRSAPVGIWHKHPLASKHPLPIIPAYARLFL